jgi:hypothetical protein
VFVAVQDVATSYKYTQFKNASFKLWNSMHLIRISEHFKLFPCPALASEGCRFMWKLCTGDFLFQIITIPYYLMAQTTIVNWFADQLE